MACTRAAMSSSASSQPTGSNPSDVRLSGVVMRSRALRSSALVQPFWHMPPTLVGNARGSAAMGSPPSFWAHCRAQYGQWVSVTVLLHPDLRHVGLGTEVEHPR